MSETKPSREELEKQVRFHDGQSQWARWSNRIQTLEEDVDRYSYWASEANITEVCDGMAAMHAAMAAELEKAKAHLATLSEFAPKPKGRKRG